MDNHYKYAWETRIEALSKQNEYIKEMAENYMNESSRVDKREESNGSTGGHASGKVRFDMMPWDALEEIAEVFTYGNQKHEPINGEWNWKHLPEQSCHISSALRHISAVLQNEPYDDETGFHHAAHAATRLMMYLHSYMNGVGEDDINHG